MNFCRLITTSGTFLVMGKYEVVRDWIDAYHGPRIEFALSEGGHIQVAAEHIVGVASA